MRFETNYSKKQWNNRKKLEEKTKCLQSYAGEKIRQIIKKTSVQFVSAESNICHILLFWICPW